MKSVALALSLLLLTPACGGGGGPADDDDDDDVAGADAAPGECDPSAEGCDYEHGFGAIDIEEGGEIDGLCQSWTLNNPTELWVREVRMSNDGAYHHANWFFVPDDTFVVPDGSWTCADQDFDELIAAVLGGVLYAMSTQAPVEVQAFPPGAAVRIPPYSRIIGNNHVLNASDQARHTEMRIGFSTIPIDQVVTKLTPFRFNYEDLNIPAEAYSEFTMTCDLRAAHESAIGKPLALDLYYILPHYHALGAAARLDIAGGDRDGENLYTLEASVGEAHNQAFDPPIHLTADGGYGFTFTCGFDNPRSSEVHYGIGDQEMCVMLGFADMEMAFDASVTGGDAEVEVKGDGTIVHSGPCSVTGFPFPHDKPGGPPR